LRRKTSTRLWNNQAAACFAMAFLVDGFGFTADVVSMVFMGPRLSPVRSDTTWEKFFGHERAQIPAGWALFFFRRAFCNALAVGGRSSVGARDEDEYRVAKKLNFVDERESKTPSREDVMTDSSPFAPNTNVDKRGPTSPRQSKLGTAACILLLISVSIIIGLVLLVAVLAILPPETSSNLVPSQNVAAAGGLALGLLATVILPLIGVCLGLAGLSRGNCRRSWTIAGLISNAVILMFSVSIIAIYFLLLAAVEHAISC